ncbi:MAG: hypothetical protein LJF04_00620 [Gemmatimonadetes bacterium]|nr:hypothetical protein [Gemmatimonadota bacterium]
MNSEQSRATAYRWIARVTGILITILTLVIGIGEALDGPRRHPGTTLLGQFTPLILVMFAVWGVGLAGLLLGWWKEKLGGILSLCCFALVFVLNLFNSQAPPAMRIGTLIPMGIYSIPSVLFIASWRLRSRERQLSG